MNKIHHIGYLVKDLNESLKEFLGIGYKKKSDVIRDLTRNIDIVFLGYGDYCLELVSPINESSTVYNLLNKIGNSPYHICYEVQNLQDAIEDYKKKGFIIIQKSQSAIALQGKKVSFLYSRSMGMIELVEV